MLRSAFLNVKAIIKGSLKTALASLGETPSVPPLPFIRVLPALPGSLDKRISIFDAGIQAMGGNMMGRNPAAERLSKAIQDQPMCDAGKASGRFASSYVGGRRGR